MAEATGSVVYGIHSATDISIRGWTADMPSIYDVNIDRGRAFTPGEVDRRLHVALIGPDIVDNQMGGEDPLGKEWDKSQDTGMVVLQPGQSTRWKVRLELFSLTQNQSQF